MTLELQGVSKVVEEGTAGAEFALGFFLASSIPFHTRSFASTAEKTTFVCFLPIFIEQSGFASVGKCGATDINEVVRTQCCHRPN